MRKRFAVLFGLGLAAALVATTMTSAAAARPGVPERATPSASQLRPNAQALALGARARPALRRLQASGNGIICIGGGASTAGSVGSSIQKCSITGSLALCIEFSSDQDADQSCNIVQHGAGTKLAIVLQVILQRNSAEAGVNSQKGGQDANVDQWNSTKANLSFVTQILKQSLGRGSDNGDDEAQQQSGIEKTAEAMGILPDFAPLVARLQANEPQQEGDEPPTPPTPGPAVMQNQQSQQTVHVCQGATGACLSPAGMTGKNLSSVYQSLRQRERAGNAVSIDQHQNPLPGTCATSGSGDRNQCAIVDQNTTNPGKNASGLIELYRQFQSGFNTPLLAQEQDRTGDHGFDHDIRQTSVGPLTGPKRNLVITIQWGNQVQRAANADVLTQFQDPRGTKGPASFQDGSAADTWFGRQLGRQIQTNNGQFTPAGIGFQEQFLNYDGETTGTFDMVERGVQNGSSAQTTCPDPAVPGSDKSCHEAVECFKTEGPPVCTGFYNPPGDFRFARRK
jgi:hypothetical protein